MSEKILGIDLGTGNSAMAILEGGTATVINNAEGQRTTPSIVAWTNNGDRLVGQSAKRQAATNPKNTVYEIKRLIGRKYDEAIDDIKKFPFEVVKAANGDCRVKIGDKLYSPEEISSFVLAKLKADAEAYLGEKITKAVITVPAYFNDSQRSSTKAAGEIAGLQVLRIINEPTASCMAFGLEKNKSGYIAVADVGCGTTDFSILEIGDGVFEVKSTSGDSQLGGKDWDARIMDWIISEFKSSNGIDLSKDPMAMQRIKDEAEKAKIELSTVPVYDINLPFITADATGPKHLQMTLSKAKFESMTDDLCERMVGPAKRCLDDAGVKVDEVILVGGTTRMPSGQKKIEEIFGLKPNKSVDPDLAVAEGASIQGGILAGEVKDIVLLDVTPLTLSICTNGQVATPMIERNTTIPCKKTQTFSNATPMQPQATIMIGQGERPMFFNNKLLGQFNVEITPMPNPGQNQIEITYDIDANGILHVEAFDRALNKKANITITSSSGLSKDEIEQAKRDAEFHAEEDKKKMELVTEKNSAESLANAIEKTLKEVGFDKLSEDEKKSIESEILNVRESIKGDSIESIKAAVEKLNKVYEPLITKIYPQQNNGHQPQFTQEQMQQMMNDPRFAQMFSGMNGGASANSTNGNGPENPVDGEVVS